MTDAPTSGTAVTASGTSVDFNSIPSTAKRITVMLSGVSTSGTSYPLIRIGAGSIETSGYTGITFVGWSGAASYADSSGFPIFYNSASYSISGAIVLTLINSNTFVVSGNAALIGLVGVISCGGSKSLSGTLDRVRITTVNGTDTFDAGTINIMWE